MYSIIDTIVRREIKKIIIMQRLGSYFTLEEVIDFVLQELESQNVKIDETHKEYIKSEVSRRLQFKLRKTN